MFYIQGIWAIPDIVKANPSIKLGVIQFPATNDAKKNKIVSGVDVMLTSFRDTPHPKEVARLIAFLTNTANTKTYIKEQFAFPCFKGIVQDDPLLAGLKPVFKSGQITSFVDHLFPAGLGAENFIQAYLQDKDQEKFLNALDNEWDKIIKRR